MRVSCTADLCSVGADCIHNLQTGMIFATEICWSPESLVAACSLDFREDTFL